MSPLDEEPRAVVGKAVRASWVLSGLPGASGLLESRDEVWI